MEEETGLPLLSQLDREEIILARHYFEHGNIEAALAAAGYKGAQIGCVKRMLQQPTSPLCQFYHQLCQDRIASTIISTEKKRIKLWKLIEWATKDNDKGKPNDSKVALQCMDMLNRMDGDYAAMEINTRQQIQKQTVSFHQRIPKTVNPVSTNEMDAVLVEHKEKIES